MPQKNIFSKAESKKIKCNSIINHTGSYEKLDCDISIIDNPDCLHISIGVDGDKYNVIIESEGNIIAGVTYRLDKESKKVKMVSRRAYDV